MILSVFFIDKAIKGNRFRFNLRFYLDLVFDSVKAKAKSIPDVCCGQFLFLQFIFSFLIYSKPTKRRPDTCSERKNNIHSQVWFSRKLITPIIAHSTLSSANKIFQ